VRFLAGTGPAYATLSARRNAATGEIPGYRSVATEGLQVRVRGPVKAQKFEVFLREDSTPVEPFDVLDGVVHTTTVTTTSRTRALVAEVLEADAADLDLFIARDANLDGRPNGAELAGGELCVSASARADERCVVHDPEPGVYWVAVQNFAASAPDALDRHVMTLATLEDGGDGLDLQAPAFEGGEPYSLQAEWNLDMQAGETWYADIEVGTEPETPNDVSRTLLRMDRVADDFSVAVDRAEVAAGEPATYTWTVATAPADAAAVAYAISADIPAGASAQVDAAGTFEDGVASWTFTQLPGAAVRSGTLTLVPDADMKEIALQFVHVVDAAMPVTRDAPTVTVVIQPVARIDGETELTVTVDEDERLILNIGESTGLGANTEFDWRQTAGAETPITRVGDDRFEMRAPPVGEDTVLEYELVLRNGSLSSEPARLAVTVRDKADAGGGAMFWMLLLTVAAGYGSRRRRLG
jgi:hypothetical protein